MLRRALQISDKFMGKEGGGVPLLIELSNYVAESFYSMYPEIGRNLKKVCLMANLLYFCLNFTENS